MVANPASVIFAIIILMGLVPFGYLNDPFTADLEVILYCSYWLYFVTGSKTFDVLFLFSSFSTTFILKETLENNGSRQSSRQISYADSSTIASIFAWPPAGENLSTIVP